MSNSACTPNAADLRAATTTDICLLVFCYVVRSVLVERAQRLIDDQVPIFSLDLANAHPGGFTGSHVLQYSDAAAHSKVNIPSSL